ncbi:hypothetical protein DRH14_01150 [Candidatus Shapirobacteria bacterium]|nr:MAG: hypothetical protein DRH14_01150 [Candidatus Shapirobacteria bacterium]
MKKDVGVEDLPYRHNVCSLVFRGDKFLLIQNLGFEPDWWKFPQGGIEAGESVEEAAKRELEEEIGNRDFRIVGKSVYTNQFDWSEKSLRLAGYRWRGQRQEFLVVEYIGDEDNIKINEKETQAFKWASLEEMLNSIDHDDSNFTNYRNTIEKVLAEFKMA